MNARQAAQYADALKAAARGQPVDVAGLPTLPDMPPLPKQQQQTAAAAAGRPRPAPGENCLLLLMSTGNQNHCGGLASKKVVGRAKRKCTRVSRC